MNLMTLLLICFFFHGLHAQQLPKMSTHKKDSTFTAAYYLSLARIALKKLDYLQVINYYEMARVCPDYSTKEDKTDWHAVVRELQNEELVAKQETIELLQKSNDAIQASEMALQSLTSGDKKERICLALQAYDTARAPTDIFSSNLLNALHNAYNSVSEDTNHLKAGIRMVKQTSDTTAWLIDQTGHFISLSLNEDGCFPVDTLFQLEPLLVKDFAWDKEVENFAFGGLTPGNTNKIIVQSGENKTHIRRLPKHVKAINAVAYVMGDLVFSASDTIVRYFPNSRVDDSFLELFQIEEIPSCFEVAESDLYIGTKDGTVLRWNHRNKTMTTVSTQETHIPVSKIRVVDVVDGSKLIVAGYADGTARVFEGNEELKKFSEHKDYITDLLTPTNTDLVIKMSVDSRVSISTLSSDRISSPRIVLSYDKLNPPIGIAFSSKDNCLLVIMKDGKVDIVHLNLSYYVTELRSHVDCTK